ncbi:MAG: ATP-dependent DNA helicase DinG, partial [Chlamydiia bacterium]|nr:ATP-dependent DNA helicase DinG [Chlamydiia bacterium]
MKSRRKLADAKLLVTNHHLLFADIAMRKEMGLRFDETAILPPYERLVLDEAHHIEDIATAYFSSRVGYVELIRLHAKLTSEKSVGKGVGRLPLLKEQLSLFPGSLENEKIQQVEHRLRFDLPIIRRELTEVITEVFLAMGILLPQGEEEEKKVRLHPHHCQSKEWQERVVTACEAFFLVAKRFQHMVLTMENDLRAIEDVQFKEKFKNLRIEILSLITRFEAYCQVLKEFVSRTSFDNEVCWIEQKRLKGGINTQCITAKLDLSDVFAERLFNSLKTTVLCSATLTAAKTFDYLKGRLGLTSELLQRGLIEKIYNSPFDFSKQALLVTPSHLPDPRDPEYLHSAAEAIWAAVEASRGRTFVLFTSYRMLQECAKLLRERFSAKKYTLLKQGDHASNHLLRQFVSAPHAVLFGTDSFWEGVDVVGEDLQCVILVKLPFKVPTEPLIQARAEHLKSQGKDPFMDYALPLAIMKFKQGFGRLVRHREDRGCVVCLDTRLIQKNYGQLFLQSLPNCP